MGTDIEYIEHYSRYLIRHIAGFLNSNGGQIFIGYNKNHKMVGTVDSFILESKVNQLLETYLAKFDDCMSRIKICTRATKKHFGLVLQIEESTVNNNFVALSKSLNDSDEQNEFYFWIKGKLLKTDKEHASYYKAIASYDLPMFVDYAPSVRKQNEDYLKHLKGNNLTFQRIGHLPAGNYLYKYMSLEAALLSLKEKSTLRLVEPTSWDDQYEGRFYNANYVGAPHNATPFLYACCFTSKRDNEAAWILYPHGQTGLSGRCVEFTLNRVKLREQLVSNCRDCSLFIGAVDYMRKYVIDTLHLLYPHDGATKNRNYSKYFSGFCLEKYLDLLLLKRTVFEHEQEVRLFLIPNESAELKKTHREKDGEFKHGEKPGTKFIDLDWIDLIEEIRVDAKFSEYEKSLLQNAIESLLQKKKNQNNLSPADYQALQEKLKLKVFNPYKDFSLAQGPLSIDVI